MKPVTSAITTLRSLMVAAVLSLGAHGVQASMEDFVSIPPLLSSSEDPLVMLVMSNDNQLWHKAYTDYTDLDGDGDLDTTYNNHFVYYGYFDSAFCYNYSSGVFVPSGKVVRPESDVTDANPDPDHRCPSGGGSWSGNFMNWMTMTRVDVLRKVLYGGYRIIDTDTNTVLQRALLPDDNHSFVKIVSNSEIEGDIDDYTPIRNESVVSFCNVTDATSGLSRSLDVTTNPPIFKIAPGNHFTWSGSERDLCIYNDEGGHDDFTPNRPSASSISGISQVEFNVRIKKCVSGQDEANCRRYTDSGGNSYYKPYGLLQTYGENGGLRFGLMTGSYKKNHAGGVLRKNIVYMGGDSAASGDREIDLDTGQFINQGSSNDGIINTLNRLRIQGWDYSTNFYQDCDTWGISISTFLNPPSWNRRCRDWGNPITEMYLEALRYFAGETAATSDFDADDSSLISGLDRVSWADPMTATNACANCAIVLLSTGINSFDGDNLGSASDLPGMTSSASIDAYTDRVGDAEGITGSQYIAGNGGTGGSTNTCDAKTISNFSAVDGICPEVPSLQGTFGVAGLAYYGFLNDLRTLNGEQNVNTYTVSLAESLPSFEIETSSGESVAFVPYCRSKHNSVWAECSLVDLTVMELTDDYGRFYISWEDSLWGSDHDMDAYSVIEYCTATGSATQVRARCPNYTSDARYGSPRPSWQAASSGQIQMRVSNIGAATGVDMSFGYIMNGSTNDGTYPDLTIYGSNFFNAIPLTGDTANLTMWAGSTRLFTAASGTPGILQNPLWYAAKYGNFKDRNDNNIPDLTSEWDETDIEGNAGADGIPDAYFPVRNPAYLETSLARVFSDITTRVSSGTAASVVASTGAGEGAVYQALYNPLFEVDSATGNTSVSWVGTLHALFIDRYSQLREDVVASGEQAGQLTSSDPIVEIYYDETEEQTMVQRYAVNTDGSRGAAMGDPVEIHELRPIWSARDQLAAVSNYVDNRTYSDLASSGRYIFTGIDNPSSRDGMISNAEKVIFDYATFNPGSSNNFRLLDAGSNEDDIRDLVEYLRGYEGASGDRPRSIEYDGDTSNGDEPWLLGDIVNSSPIALAKPVKNFDISYGDSTFLDYKNAVADRRQVVFVGANDGMLHAFNAGFYSADVSGYKTSLAGETAHPLGSELWAYVPYNLLPHLQYLQRTDYQHVYYVDGQPQIFDVNGIWSSDSTTDHPEDWGSILVVGMRFGGGEVTLDPDDPDADTSDDITLRSGFVVLDVTDPESPPEIIAEITHEDLGYTTALPTLVKFRAKNSSTGSFANPSRNEWYLVFGSGPAGADASGRATALDNATSEKTAKLFAFNLKTRQLSVFDTGVSNAFIGGLQAADWNNDFQDDAVYFGIVGGTEANPTGQLMRAALTLGSNLALSFSPVLDVYDQPFSAPPTVVRDRSNDFWVYSGSGRYFTSGDNSSSATQSFYGIKDPDASMATLPGQLVAESDLVNTTSIQVFTDGTLRYNGSSPFNLNTGEQVETFNELLDAVGDHSGWYFNLPYGRERASTRAELSDESIIFTTYQPTGEICEAEGDGFLYAPHFQAGVPGPFAPLDTDDSVTFNSEELVNMGIGLGVGSPSSPTIYQDARGRNRAIIQTSTGEIVNQEIAGRARTGKRQSWREIPLDW